LTSRKEKSLLSNVFRGIFRSQSFPIGGEIMEGDGKRKKKKQGEKKREDAGQA